MDLATVLEKETLFIGHIKAKSNETDVKKLLDRYAPSESEAKNSEILGCSSEIKKAHLDSRIDYSSSVDVNGRISRTGYEACGC